MTPNYIDVHIAINTSFLIKHLINAKTVLPIAKVFPVIRLRELVLSKMLVILKFLALPTLISIMELVPARVFKKLFKIDTLQYLKKIK